MREVTLPAVRRLSMAVALLAGSGLASAQPAQGPR